MDRLSYIYRDIILFLFEQQIQRYSWE